MVNVRVLSGTPVINAFRGFLTLRDASKALILSKVRFAVVPVHLGRGDWSQGMVRMAFTLGAAGLSLWQKDAQHFPLLSPVGLTFPFFPPCIHLNGQLWSARRFFLLILSPERLQQAFTHRVYRENGQAIFVSI